MTDLLDEDPLIAELKAIDGFDVALARDMTAHDVDLLERLIRLFLASHHGEPANLRRLMSLGDHAGICGVIHNLKSAAGMIGASEVAVLAGNIQAVLRRRDDIPVREVRRLADETEAILVALGKAIEAKSNAPMPSRP